MADAVVITFPEAGRSEANRMAGSLSLVLQRSDRNVSVARRRDSGDAQDGGTTLAIILGSAAVGSVAKGLSSWLAKHAGTAVRIHSPDGTWVDIKNATGQDTAQIVAAALQKS